MNPILMFVLVAESHGLNLARMSHDKGRYASDARAEWYAAVAETGVSKSAIARMVCRSASSVSRAMARRAAKIGDNRKNNGRTA